MIPDGDSQIMVDNHDNQRGHGLIFQFSCFWKYIFGYE
jgi:hypothetical protein